YTTLFRSISICLYQYFKTSQKVLNSPGYFLFSRFRKTLYSLTNFITHTLKFGPLFSSRIIKSPMFSLHMRRCHWAPISCISTKRNCKRSEEHTSELQSRFDLVCRLLLEKKKNSVNYNTY